MPPKSRHKAKSKQQNDRQKKTRERLPAIYYSDKPVSLKDWQAGKNSPNPKAPRKLE